jgi:hypothetical protein
MEASDDEDDLSEDENEPTAGSTPCCWLFDSTRLRLSQLWTVHHYVSWRNLIWKTVVYLHWPLVEQGGNGALLLFRIFVAWVRFLIVFVTVISMYLFPFAAELNLSDNKIHFCALSPLMQCPRTLIRLHLNGNPAVEAEDGHSRAEATALVISCCPQLKEFNNKLLQVNSFQLLLTSFSYNVENSHTTDFRSSDIWGRRHLPSCW